MKYFCCACGRPVPLRQQADGKWVACRCRFHPDAKRYSESWAHRMFRAAKDACGATLGELIGERREQRRPYAGRYISDVMWPVIVRINRARRAVKGGAS